jgi:Tfp pilus assembly protein PilE
MTNSTVYNAYAEQARREAATTALPNVRDRLERSASAWQDMATRAERTEAARDKKADALKEAELRSAALAAMTGDTE